MSTQTLGATDLPSDEAAVSARIQQIQTMIASADGVSSTPSTTGDFAATLQEASAPGGESSGQYDSMVEEAARRYGIEPAVLHGLIEQESGFDPSATSSAGAEGLTQLMPGTASSMGVSNPLNPSESIEGGARYLSQLLNQFGGNVSEALAAYNAGPGAVEQYGGIPPYGETESYVSKVLADAETYRQTSEQPATTTGAP